MCTGSSALVRPVIAAAAASGSRLSVTGSMSANTGLARSNRIAFADATNENGDVTTSSPSVTPTARRARCSAAVPDDTRARVARAEPLRERLLERRDARAERELARAQHLDHGALLGLAEDRAGERDDVGRGGHACGARVRTMPASSESTSASQLASITFSCTPIAPQVSVPSVASSSTRVVAPVAFHSSRMRTL